MDAQGTTETHETQDDDALGFAVDGDPTQLIEDGHGFGPDPSTGTKEDF